jgi:hypothetical protein
MHEGDNPTLLMKDIIYKARHIINPMNKSKH